MLKEGNYAYFTVSTILLDLKIV